MCSREVVPIDGASLLPRGPLRDLAKALAKPCTASAIWLREFSESISATTEPGQPLYVTIAPEMGCSIDGIASDSSPDGEMIAVQAMFSMMWTGAHGRLTPWKPTELAVAVLPLLGTTEMVEMYIKKLVVQALDSPVTATLVEAHIAALVAGAAATRHLICRTMACAIVSELKRASLRMSTADCRGHELVVTNKFPHELDTAGDEHVAAAYRLLVAIGLAQSRVGAAMRKRTA
jgi:hypothetical protein